jgi:hypothetical protein
MSFWPVRMTIAEPSPLDSAGAAMRELSEGGIDIPPHIATPILEARRVGDLSEATPELQQKFWSAYGTLNSKIKSPEEAKRHCRRFFYGILSALLLLQLYYSAFITVQKGLLEVGNRIEAVETAPVANAATDKGSTKKSDLEDKRKTYLNVTEYLMGIPRKIAGFLTVIGLGTDEKLANRPEIVAQVELELATSFVGAFLLPVLYGMLGAIAFVLRRLSDETLSGEARTLKRRYSLRVPIGALSGLAAGWLLQSPAGSVTASLSPFALAFVAGYSADLVFAAMDRIVAAFSTPQPPAPEMPAASKPTAPLLPPADPPQPPYADDPDEPPGAPSRDAGLDHETAATTPTATVSRPREAPMPSSRAQANQDVTPM